MTVICTNGFSRPNTDPTASQQRTSILVLNLMPNKQGTEDQIISLFEETNLPIALTFMYPKSHVWRHGDQTDLAESYVSLADISDQYFDGLLVTGAPLEKLDFDDVDFWEEFNDIRDWSQTHTTTQLFTCWSAQAALYTDFRLPKINLEDKIFGVFENQLLGTSLPQWFQIPQSRFSAVDRTDVLNCPAVSILGDNQATGPFILKANNQNTLYVLGHPEYNADTLSAEYYRDLEKHQPVKAPENISLTAPQFAYAHWRCCSRYLYQEWVKQSFLLKENNSHEQKQLQF